MAPLTSSNVVQRQRHGPTSQSIRRAAAVIVGASAIALTAIAYNSANAAGNLSRAVQEQHACAVVMGLRQPGDLYDTYIRSLNKTLSEVDQARQSRRTEGNVSAKASGQGRRLSQCAWSTRSNRHPAPTLTWLRALAIESSILN